MKKLHDYSKTVERKLKTLHDENGKLKSLVIKTITNNEIV